MTHSDTPLPASPGRGASGLRCRIIAALCQNDGVCIMCLECGHIFVDSKPLSDESHEVDNVELSKSLYYHLCAMPKRTAWKETRRI
jgi:hypothetical protein